MKPEAENSPDALSRARENPDPPLKLPAGPLAAEELLPLVYDELRRLAAHKMAGEAAGQTLQPTALVHEAWLRLAGSQEQSWNSRAHFFGAAAEAMRRILVEKGRRKRAARHGGGQVKLDALLKKNSVSVADLKSQLQAQMLQDAVKAKVASQTKLTDAQLLAYFNDPKNKHQFATAESVDAKHILVKTQAEALKIQKLLQANNTPAEWAKLAKQYSIDPGSKNSGGSLGNFTKGRMVKPFEDVAFSLKVGQVSAPVKTQFGYHIIEVTKKTPATAQTFAQAKAQIKSTLLYTQQTTAWDKWLKTTLAAAGIKYAAGFNPADLTPSPSASPSPSAT